MAIGEGVATRQSLLWRRLQEKVRLWQRLFVLNWNLFKASRIGVVGLAIMIAFVLLALAAPFMGLRDPIRWTAPDEDLIEVAQYWEFNSAQGGSEFATAPPITQGVAFRINPPKALDARADRVYIPAGDRLYAFLTVAGDVRRNAWGTGDYVDVKASDQTPRTISVAPLVMNYGFLDQEPPDFELYLGTDDGKVVILRDQASQAPSQKPAAEPLINLSGRVTGIAAFNHDGDGKEFVIGRANYLTYNGTGVNWTYREVPGAQLGDEGEFTSLGLNGTGPIVQPVLAYYDVSRGTPKVSAWMGSRWEFLSEREEGVEPYNTNPQFNLGFFTSLALGSDGLPRLAYQDQSDVSLKFAIWNGTAWNTSYVDVGNVGQFASLALDGSNGVHIAYYDASSGRLKYRAGNSVAWNPPEIADDTTGADVGQYASLALDASGVPHVAYYDSVGALKHAWKVGPLWQNETVVGVGVGGYASLAFDPTDLPAIAYYNANGSLGFVRQTAPGVWMPPETVDDSGADDVGLYASLAFSPLTGEPAIAYQDVTNYDLKLANKTGFAWRSATIRSDSHTGFYNSLKFDANGYPHVGFYAYSTGRSAEDFLVAGTASGNVYGIDVSIPGSLARLDRAKIVSRWDYRIRWNVTVGSEVHIAGAPLSKIGGTPAYSPAFSNTGAAVFLGTEDGRLLALNTTDGGNFWWRGTESYVWMGSPWHTAPVVHYASSGPAQGSELVYAATSFLDWDTNNTETERESLLVVRYANDAAPLSQWFQEYRGYNGSAFIGPTSLQADGGDLTQPVVDGDNIYLGSSKGRLYAIRRDGQGEYPTWGLAPASVRWIFEDPTLLGLDPQFRATPLFVSDSLVLLATANHNNGTAGDPSDDRAVLYSLRSDQGNVSWKRTLPSPVNAMPQSWKQTSSPGAIHPSVWVTYGGAGRTNGVIALATVGLFLAPSEPSWAHEYKCPLLGDPNRMCSGYPSGNQYWLGLDSQGRDIFSQVIWGSRIALLVGFLSAFFTVVLGVIVGLIAGYVGGKTESILMRFTDVILVLPGLPLIITLAAVLGASIWNIILVISLLGWPGVARIIRAEVLSLKERPFIDSARVSGASTTRIVFRHIAPNVMPLAFLYMTFSVSGAILTEAALSFIGLGDISTMSWGIMLQLVSQSEALKAWWWLLPPGLAITLISLAFFLVGRAFDEIVNPRLRKR